MSACDPAGTDSEPDFDAAIAVLRARGAQRVDPIGLHFIESLARRAAAQQGAVRSVLHGKLAVALAACGERLSRAAADADADTDTRIASGRQSIPHATPSPLADLVLHIQQQGRHRAVQNVPVRAAEAGEAGVHPGVIGTRGELPALQFFRATWARLRMRRQLTQSLAKVPENAGPLHSDRLVLRALQTMQDLSPAYLSRYMAYVDALFWLDLAHGGAAAAPSLTARGDSDKKRKSGRNAART